MEKPKNFLLTIPAVAIGTMLLLLVPLIAMQFTDEVNWSLADFMVMGLLIFVTGVLLVYALRSGTHIAYRAAMVLALGTTFLLIWANLAVGLIGSGAHAGNLMYMAVVVAVAIGIYVSKFKAAGLEKAMFVVAFILLAIGGVQLIANMQDYPGSSVKEIISVNLFFATGFMVSGLLFRYTARQVAH